MKILQYNYQTEHSKIFANRQLKLPNMRKFHIVQNVPVASCMRARYSLNTGKYLSWAVALLKLGLPLQNRSHGKSRGKSTAAGSGISHISRCSVFCINIVPLSIWKRLNDQTRPHFVIANTIQEQAYKPSFFPQLYIQLE